MISTNTYIFLYIFDPITQQYNLNFTKNYTTTIYLIQNTLTTDGRILIRMFTQTYNADIEVEILALDSLSGTYTSTSHLLNIDTTSSKSFMIARIGNKNGTYHLIIGFKRDMTYILNYYQITTTTLTHQQQIYQGPFSYYDIYLTQDA